MNRQHRINTGDLLYHYYQKRNASFLVYINKAGITATENDIHKARIELKKIFALFDFFMMIGLDPFKIEEPKKIFHDLYLAAGKIREIQMNLLYMEKLGKDDPEMQYFSDYLTNNSKKATKRFIKSIIRIDEKQINLISRSIKKNRRNIKIEKIIEKCVIFFQLHSARIRKYRLKSVETENIHKIRKEMKKISAVAGLLKFLRVDEFIERLIVSLNQTELIIGEWHDRVILYKSLDTFIKNNENKDGQKFGTLESVKNVVDKDINALLQKLLPEVDTVINLIDQIPFLRKV
jgi:CHAD domain-containing protein